MGAQEPDGSDAAPGKPVFSNLYSGQDGIQGEPARDLRRLTLRYGNKVDEVFLTIALDGRPDKGMPP